MKRARNGAVDLIDLVPMANHYEQHYPQPSSFCIP